MKKININKVIKEIECFKFDSNVPEYNLGFNCAIEAVINTINNNIVEEDKKKKKKIRIPSGLDDIIIMY